MDNTIHKESYINQFNKLIEIIDTSNNRMISDEPDIFFIENSNFFTKSFLVVMCAYLESYLKDALMVVIDETNLKLSQKNIPHNLIKWSLNIEKDFKDADSKIEPLKIKIKKKELDDFISGSPFRTRDLFKKFGIILEQDSIFLNQKDRINNIVLKRNRIVHHNDDASDISNADLIENIGILSEYITNLDKLICNQI
ncbi:HEPN domain-containing protein [Flavobacterium sp. XS1P32]|uniref:HEPN domain-containing protein n=1 Tax=unclassified Flavobacterium TaxID=196869 RepID=UPI003AB0DF4B